MEPGWDHTCNPWIYRQTHICCQTRNRIHYVARLHNIIKKITKTFHPYKTKILFMGHIQAVQTQIRHRRTQRLIKISNVCLLSILLQFEQQWKKMTTLKLEIDKNGKIQLKITDQLRAPKGRDFRTQINKNAHTMQENNHRTTSSLFLQYHYLKHMSMTRKCHSHFNFLEICISLYRKLSMTRKCHNHTQQTYSQHHEEELQKTTSHTTSRR